MNMQWEQETLPSTKGNVIGPKGISINDITVAIDGSTIWAAPGNTVPQTIYKSTNSGVTWEALPTNVPFPSGTNADLVAVAPDNSNYVAICDKKINTILLSTNGGSTWVILGIPDANGVKAKNIFEICFSPSLGGVSFLAIAGKDINLKGNIWYWVIGTSAPQWSLIPVQKVSSVLTVAFSPSFPSDQTMLIISTGENNDQITLEEFSFQTKQWNMMNFSGRPFLINKGAVLTDNSISACITLDPTYYNGDPASRIGFLGIDNGGSTLDGIYRISTNCSRILIGKRIYSLAWDGTLLVAGQTDSNIIFRSHDALSSHLPTFLPSSSNKSPSGSEKVIVSIAGGNVFTGSTGPMSAFAVSNNLSASFNDISLIDTKLQQIDDVIGLSDGIKYVVSNDGINTSVWRLDRTWKRILALRNIGKFIVRIAPNDSNIIYVASTTTTEIFKSSDGGYSKWIKRSGTIIPQNLLVENDSVVYIKSGKTIFKSTNGGFTWGLLAKPEVSEVKDNVISIRTPVKFTLTHKYPFDVVLSYASEDIKIPEALAAILKTNGVRVFFDRNSDSILWGKDLYRHFIQIFQNSARFCVVFISNNYAVKFWTNHELEAAQARALEEVNKEYILPVRLDDTKIPSILPTIKYIDARKLPVEQIADLLIQKLSTYP